MGGSLRQTDFVKLMGEVLARSDHVPRNYLLPDPLRVDYAPPTFHPAITARSKVGPSCEPFLFTSPPVRGTQALTSLISESWDASILLCI